MPVTFTIDMNYFTLSPLCWKLIKYRHITRLSVQYLYRYVNRGRCLQNYGTETVLETRCFLGAAQYKRNAYNHSPDS
jgi:hypothetical protein